MRNIRFKGVTEFSHKIAQFGNSIVFMSMIQRETSEHPTWCKNWWTEKAPTPGELSSSYVWSCLYIHGIEWLLIDWISGKKMIDARGKFR